MTDTKYSNLKYYIINYILKKSIERYDTNIIITDNIKKLCFNDTIISKNYSDINTMIEDLNSPNGLKSLLVNNISIESENNVNNLTNDLVFESPEELSNEIVTLSDDDDFDDLFDNDDVPQAEIIEQTVNVYFPTADEFNDAEEQIQNTTNGSINVLNQTPVSTNILLTNHQATTINNPNGISIVTTNDFTYYDLEIPPPNELQDENNYTFVDDESRILNYD
jgi:hypothetical protein